jgi:hypothetical protein
MFFDKNSDFISVTPSWQAFQALRGGKICLGYFYPNFAMLISIFLLVNLLELLDKVVPVKVLLV